MKNLAIFIAVLTLAATAKAGEMSWSFKNPAFHYGNGYSTHVITTEQLQFNRKQELADRARAERERLERELENTTLNKFVKNVESRIYATLSKQMVDSMFADCNDNCASSGTAEIEGSTINWVKDPTTGEITLSITGEDGTLTEISIPGSGEFNF